MRRLVFSITILALLVTAVGCGQDAVESEPKGSVLEKSGEWIPEETYYADEARGELTRFRATARVQNVGGDGPVRVSARVEPDKWLGSRTQSVEVYLRTGEERTLSFEWWAKGGLKYWVWIPND